MKVNHCFFCIPFSFTIAGLFGSKIKNEINCVNTKLHLVLIVNMFQVQKGEYTGVLVSEALLAESIFFIIFPLYFLFPLIV